jgi:hypothetical protein
VEARLSTTTKEKETMSKPYTIRHGRKVLFAPLYQDAHELAAKLVQDSTCCATIQDPAGRVVETLDPDPLPEHHEHGGPDDEAFEVYDTLIGDE